MQAVDTTTLKVGIKERWTPTDVITTPGDATKAGKTATAATMTRKAATKANRTLGGATTIRRDATKGGAMPTAVTTTRRAVIRDAISNRTLRSEAGFFFLRPFAIGSLR